MLDAFGGVHAGDGAPAISPPTPYFGFDVARAIVYRDIPTRASANTTIQTTLTLNIFVAFLTTTVVAPDDGFILVSASANVACSSTTGTTTAHLSANVDSTQLDLSLQNYNVGFSDCSHLPPGVGTLSAPVSLTRLYPVTAGSHTINFLGRKVDGTLDPVIVGASLTAVFIDQDGMGGS